MRRWHISSVGSPDFTLATQNNRRPAHEGEQPDVGELHGNILRSKCSLEGEVAEPEEYDDCVPPRCPRCGGFLRPEVAWFGEMMPPGALEAASEPARGYELFFSIGTSSLVYTAATLPYEALGAARRSSR
jgi:NAD-dependent deacetylase